MRKLSGFVLFVAVSTFVAAQSTPQQLAADAAKQNTVACSAVTTAKTCHARYVAGCGRTAGSPYDPYLDFFKNQPLSTAAPAETIDMAKLQALEKATPASLTKDNHKDFSADFVKLNEGEIVETVGYLYYAESTGAESTNCELTGPANTDIHIGIGFDASKVKEAQAKPAANTPQFLDLQAHSMIVEMTPHTRPTTWTLAKLQAAYGKQVRVVGQLMADNDHHSTADDCSLSGATSSCWRLSIWEIHPVSAFYVCTARTPCSESNSSGWTKLGSSRGSSGGTTGGTKKHPKKPTHSPPPAM